MGTEEEEERERDNILIKMNEFTFSAMLRDQNMVLNLLRYHHRDK